MSRERKKLTGIQKAAILFITLGPDASAKIIKKLPENEIQKITYEIANINSVSSSQREEIMQEFLHMNRARDYVKEGGIDYAKTILSQALGNQKAMEIIATITEITQKIDLLQ